MGVESNGVRRIFVRSMMLTLSRAVSRWRDRAIDALRVRSDNQQRPGGRSGGRRGGQGKPPAGNPGGGGKPGAGGKPGQAAPGGGPSRGMFYVLIALAGAVVLVLFLSSAQSAKEVDLGYLITAIERGDIESPIIARSDRIEATERAQAEVESDRAERVRVTLNSATAEPWTARVNEVAARQPDLKVIARSPSPWVSALLLWVPMILIFLLIFFFISRAARAAAGGGGMLGSFGKSRHRTLTKEMTNVTFKDVAGVDEAKEEVTEIIEFLRNPKKFTRLGGRIPRGVLLVGDPGCGKTLLAKAIAGEADVPFFSISGSDFVEMFVGVGASRVRDLFKQAKESSPCIIFLDEIDAVGRRRGNGFSGGGGHDEREQTLNAILVEMDGFNTSDGVIVIAATNRVDVLDPALTRPGRFDRQITVPLPDLKGRVEILKVHSDKVKLGPEVDLERVARGTPMFSGAELAAIINEAAIGATMADKDFIEQEDLEEGRDKIRFGRAKRGRVREKDENKLVAYHEAGHAVLQALLRDGDPLHKVTIIPRGGAGGATFSLPEKDRMGYGLKWLRTTMRVLCGGRIAEARAMNDVSTGASQDIAQVTQLARAMVLEWGMSDRLGFVRYAPSDNRQFQLAERDYSDDTAHLIDNEVRRLVDEAYAEAEKLLDERWEAVDRVADALIRFETLSADEVNRLIRGETLQRSSVADLLAGPRPRSGTATLGDRASRAAEDDGDEPGASTVVPSPA